MHRLFVREGLDRCEALRSTTFLPKHSAVFVVEHVDGGVNTQGCIIIFSQEYKYTRDPFLRTREEFAFEVSSVLSESLPFDFFRNKHQVHDVLHA